MHDVHECFSFCCWVLVDLHVAIRTVYPFVLPVDVRDSKLDPLHVLGGFFLRKFAGMLCSPGMGCQLSPGRGT